MVLNCNMYYSGIFLWSKFHVHKTEYFPQTDPYTLLWNHLEICSEVRCGGLNENGPRRLMYSHIWSPVVWGGLGSVALLVHAIASSLSPYLSYSSRAMSASLLPTSWPW